MDLYACCVQVSAAAFAKGLLDLEGNSLTPILVSLVSEMCDPRHDMTLRLYVL